MHYDFGQLLHPLPFLCIGDPHLRPKVSVSHPQTNLQPSTMIKQNLDISPTAGATRHAGEEDIDFMAELRALEFAERDLQQQMDRMLDLAAEEALC